VILPWTTTWSTGSSSVLQGAYAFRWDAYRFTTLPQENLDGITHHFELGPQFRCGGGKRVGRLALTYDRAHPDGTSMRYRAWGARAQFAASVGSDLRLDLSFTHRDPRYTDPNVRDQAFPARRREDVTNAWHVALTRQLSPRNEITLFYSRLHNHSNIPAFFAYKQEQFGVTYRCAF
jgi:hypothetical protein